MRGDPKNPTISRIATEAGVSRAAVSLALRNHPRISEATRRKIQAVAERLGWRPNPLLAQAMSVLRAGQPTDEQVTLAWVTMYKKRDGWRELSFYRRTFDGAVARAQRTGFRLEHFWVGDANGSFERLCDILFHRGISGLVFAPLPAPGALPEVDWTRFAATAIGFSLESPRMHRVIDHHNASARAAVTRLQEAGYRRIGLVIEKKFDRRIHGLLTSGYFWQMNDRGMFDPELLFMPEGLRETDFTRWRREVKPEAIISGHQDVPHWLRMAQVRMPDELAFVSLDVIEPDSALSGVWQDAEAVGACAIDTVAGQLIRNERGLPEKPRCILIDGRWVEGGTTPDGPGRAAAVAAAESFLQNNGEIVFPQASPV